MLPALILCFNCKVYHLPIGKLNKPHIAHEKTQQESICLSSSKIQFILEYISNSMCQNAYTGCLIQRVFSIQVLHLHQDDTMQTLHQIEHSGATRQNILLHVYCATLSKVVLHILFPLKYLQKKLSQPFRWHLRYSTTFVGKKITALEGNGPFINLSRYNQIVQFLLIVLNPKPVAR